jgi:hypothetical protein
MYKNNKMSKNQINMKIIFVFKMNKYRWELLKIIFAFQTNNHNWQQK